jgi:tetratricopeptide (TPR) repeat protein
MNEPFSDHIELKPIGIFVTLQAVRNMKFEKHLTAAKGYLDLGMIDEAQRELKEIPVEFQTRIEVLAFWVEIFSRLKKWKQMRLIAQQLIDVQPNESQWWIGLAFATRRGQSLNAAREILLRAEKLHPRDPTIQYNLGCYACLMGEYELAKQYVRKSFSIDNVFRKMAKQDPDLEPLREEFKHL